MGLLLHLLLAGDGTRRALAGAGIGVGALAADRQTPTMAQAEWTLAVLISSWMHWLYLYSSQTEDDGLC